MSTPAHEPFNPSKIYGYTPSRGVAALFLTLFAISAILHLGQAIRYRTWWMIPTMVFCTLFETVGWGGRLWSTFSTDLGPYLMQSTTILLAPSFMTAATFTTLGRIIPRLGAQYSWLSPRMYLIIFLSADIGALFIQSAGGALVATSTKSGNADGPGAGIMAGGVIFQMVAITLFVFCAISFLLRHHFDRPARDIVREQNSEDTSVPVQRALIDRGTKLMLLGLLINTFFVYIRSIYRTIELTAGWDAPIVRNETLFNVLDGLPIIIACFTFNAFHPGHLLRPVDPKYESVALGEATPFQPSHSKEPFKVARVARR